ncbi:hypothetical protein GCM10017714_05430 [Curtobacterium pusillum]|nr:hypothetical protein GCM10017610_00910 [Curtobacterium pusillum]
MRSPAAYRTQAVRRTFPARRPSRRPPAVPANPRESDSVPPDIGGTLSLSRNEPAAVPADRRFSAPLGLGLEARLA